MKKKFLFFIYVVIACVVVLFLGECNAASYTELAIPKSNGAYFNNLEFPTDTIADPFILKHNDTYYIYSSGNRIMKSNDFKNWKMVTYQAVAMEPEYNNYWAFEVYKYNNKFYMFYTGAFFSNSLDKNKRDILVAVSDSPEGPFVKKAKINSKVNMPIDPNVLFDDDGRIYLYTKSEIGNSGTCCNGDGTAIYVEELNSDLLSVKNNSQPKKVLQYNITDSRSSTNTIWEMTLIEGSYIIKEHGKYYLLYSTGGYSNNTYAVGYAVSDSPTGNFVRKTTNSTSALLYGQLRTTNYDSSKYIYSTGHPSILKVSNDEMYIVYHSAKYNNNTFAERKFNADYIGFDANGTLFVNGPNNTNQPLPSGNMGLYKLAVGDYKVNVNNSISKSLNDNINYNVLNTSTSLYAQPLTKCDTISTSSLTIELNKSKNIEDIWLFGEKKGFGNIKANAIINDKYIVKNYSLGNTGTAKIQLPTINEPINKIQIDFTNSTLLSEVSLYYNTKSTYTVTFKDSEKIIANKSCTTNNGKCSVVTPGVVNKAGHVFIGWGNSECTSKSGANTNVEVSSNVIFYACFEKEKVTYNVTFKDGEQVIATKKCTTTEEKCIIETEKAVSKDGYIFTGWGNENCINGTNENTNIEVSDNIVLYACYANNILENKKIILIIIIIIVAILFVYLVYKWFIKKNKNDETYYNYK